MSNYRTLSTFKIDWIVKSVPFKVKFSKAYRVTKFDTIFCTIVNEMGGTLEINKLASMLGFNTYSDKGLNKYADSAEKEIFEFYLQKVLDFKLLEVKNNFVQITPEGIESLSENLKYKYFSINTGIFQHLTAKEDDVALFSFKKAYGLSNEIFEEPIDKLEKTENSLVNQKIDFQIFENDIFQGSVIDSEQSDIDDSYKEFVLDVSLLQNENGAKTLKFKHKTDDCFEIDELVNSDINYELKEEIIRKGEFYHYLSLNKPIDSIIIVKYLDLWNWRKLAENDNVVWKDEEIFDSFTVHADRSIWEIISNKVPIQFIEPVLNRFTDFWSWAVLTERFNNKFLKDNIFKFPWDFEVISKKETEFVLILLEDKKLHSEYWDWEYLSLELPEKYIIQNIENFRWDYYNITTSRFDIFKDAFNNAFRSKSSEVLKKGWDWKYISKEINLKILYKHINLFAPFINWDISLRRFFTDSEITEKILNDASFPKLLAASVSRSFIINSQAYHWTEELINLFDRLNKIQWETHSYINGFDQNKSVDWNLGIFGNFHEKIKTAIGFSTVSSQISDYNLLNHYPDFEWDWEAISKNDAIVSKEYFILDTLLENSHIAENLQWDSIYENYPMAFWNSNLENVTKSISREDNKVFYQLLTIHQDFAFIIDNIDFNWDWNLLSEKVEMPTIIGHLNNVELLDKWNWEVLTPRFTKAEIDAHLEHLNYVWDWQYLVDKVFEYNKELKLEDSSLKRIALCLKDLNEEIKAKAWSSITNSYPIGILFKYINETKNDSLYAWDWKAISANKHLKTDLLTLHNLRDNLDWSELSSNQAIKKMFDPKEEWNNPGEYLQHVKKYLKSFSSEWDWNVLSRNESLNWNRKILRDFTKQEWDWEYLSEYGKFLTRSKRDSDNYLIKLLAGFPKINVALVSKRNDVEINETTLVKTANLNWDWKEISSNLSVRLSGNTLLKLHNKDWDWELLTSRSDIQISNELLFELKTKNWDWKKLSSSKELIFSQEFLLNFLDKPWDWFEVSKSPSFTPTQTLLPKIKHFDLDWNQISKHPELPINREILTNFGKKLNWVHITQHPKLDVDQIDLISEFEEFWDWKYLSRQSSFPLNEPTIIKFERFLDWEYLSSNTNLAFNRTTILRFLKKWNWSGLRNNIKVKEVLGNFVEETVESVPKIKFLASLDGQNSYWKDSIYHFTHIDNAIEIIKNRKIQSRSKAKILADAAGNVVKLRDDAHAYARFYFRPHTPTQFYNEFLGKSISSGYETKEGNWVSWYEKSRGLGFPKCPVPIFFRFSLKEVVFDETLTQCISNGNMQTKSTKFGSIENMVNLFGYENLYDQPEKYSTSEDYRIYRTYSQQEFLIKDELDFSKYQNFQIVCASPLDSNLLKKMLGAENLEIYSKIVVDPSFYNYENPRMDVEFQEDGIILYSEYEGEGIFALETTYSIDKNDITKGDVQSFGESEIFFKSNLSLSQVKEPFKIKFIDESNREWMIFKSR